MVKSNSMKHSIYDFIDYREYLQFCDQNYSKGFRTSIANATNTTPAFISRFFSNLIELSLEHGQAINQYLQHSDEESHYFLLLISKARAGTNVLKKYFSQQIEAILADRNDFSKRTKIKDVLSQQDEAIYYSQWYFAAIHILTAIPKYQTIEAISQRLHLSDQLVHKTLKYLSDIGLVTNKDSNYVISNRRLHTSKKSNWIVQKHTFLRNRALSTISNNDDNDLHFSMELAISKQDCIKLREKILKLLEEFEPILAISKEEELFGFDLDLFRY